MIRERSRSSQSLQSIRSTNPDRLITSPRNPRVRAARKLLRRNARDEAGRFLVEGPTVIRDALASGAQVEELFVERDDLAARQMGRSALREGTRVWETNHDVIASLTETVTPQGVVAVVRDPSVTLERLSQPDLVVVLLGVRDPGNAGTILRSAAAADVDAVIFAADSVDPLHPKVVRASAGSLFNVSVVRAVDGRAVLQFLKSSGVTTVGTAASGSKALTDLDLKGRVAIVLGNEAWGLPPELAELVDETAAIPMPGGIESLNVAVAGSIFLYEIIRQRGGDAL